MGEAAAPAAVGRARRATGTGRGEVIPLESVAALTSLAILLAGCQQPQAIAGSDEVVTVTGVVDGDTLIAQDSAGHGVRVRLLGIDAPELAHAGTPGECGAADARDALQRLVLHHQVTLADDPRADRTDRYGRRLAYVDLTGVDVGLRQLEAGYASAWYPRSEPRPARSPAYQDAERGARRASAGAWATCTQLGR